MLPVHPVRNAGNLIPHSQHFVNEVYTTEPAALELGCIINDIKHVIVCGHSDCKVTEPLIVIDLSTILNE